MSAGVSSFVDFLRAGASFGDEEVFLVSTTDDMTGVRERRAENEEEMGIKEKEEGRS